MHPMLNTAIKAARKAGNIIMRGFERADSLKLTEKGANDFATETDHQAEREIVQILQKAYPSHSMVCEESGEHPGDDFIWYIDPIDGTANFMRGLPHFCVSIALKVKDTLEVAVIYDPARQELFTATKGGGAQLNDRRIRINQKRTLAGGLISLGLPYYEEDWQPKIALLWQALVPEIAGMRRFGSAALDLAYVAASRLEAYCEIDLKPWDIAAGALIVKEAGGLVTDLKGNDAYLDNGQVFAANQKCYSSLMKHMSNVL